MSKKTKHVLWVTVVTLLCPLFILYLIANHYIENRYNEALRYVILEFFVDLYNAWREIFGLKYVDKSVELSRYNRKLMYGKPIKRLLGLSKEQMEWLLDNTRFYSSHVWKSGKIGRDMHEYCIEISKSSQGIEFYKDRVVMLNNDTGWLLETDFEGLQENIDNKKFTEWSPWG